MHAQAEQALQQLVAPDASSAIADPRVQFLDSLRDIAAGKESQRQAFVAATEDRVHQCAEQFSEYLVTIENTLLDSEWEGDEWLFVCRGRTRIADLLSLYAHRFTDTQILLWLDTEQVDESIKERSEFEGPADAKDIPPGTPQSHWWWWHPGDPPAS